ncbi:MAG: type II toxin-antitoxin system VapC family toxin [Holophagales bacterium]|nr:type II toxin-antitoxin system VapC family toxin [Holophagales bacterium]
MIFIDSNIPMYLVGAAHPLKAVARARLEEAISGGERLVTSAEVLQEILHRYVAIERREAIRPALDAILGVVDEVYPVERADVEKAAEVLAGRLRVSARDALHVAVMARRRVKRILSFDGGFDGVPGIERIS